MSKRNLILIISGVVIVLVAGIYWWLQQRPAPARGFPPSVISATEVSAENWAPTLSAVGSFVATNGIDISTEVSGIVSEVVFTSGQPVAKGDVLVKLDDAVDLAALEALRAERKLAEVQYLRAKDLLQKKVTSKSQFDEAQARYDAARARVKQQETIVQRKVIRAPFAGRAGIRQVDIGEYLEAGKAIVSLHALDPIHVDYSLAERFVSRVKVGQIVNIRLDAIPDRTFQGKVTAVNSGVDTGTRTMKVRATLENPDRILIPGMFASVETITDVPQAVLTLPRTAISFNTYGNFVFVIHSSEKGMTVKHTPVETGETREGRIIVKNLSAGTQVVRTGLVKLRDGAPVKIDNQVEMKDAVIQTE